MLASTVAVVILFVATSATLDCKGVEITVSTLTTAIPMDVCYSVTATLDTNGDGVAETTGVSFWYFCDHNNEAVMAAYGEPDCQGAMTGGKSQLVQALQVPTATVNAYCDLPACPYVTVNTLTTMNLDCDDPSTTDISASSGVAFVADYCNEVSVYSSTRWTCTGTEGRQETFLNGDCSGNATIALYDIAVDVSCDQTGSVSGSAALDLTCGTAAFHGDANYINPIYS
eukprot:UN00642